jgi:general secretion pathway protein A
MYERFYGLRERPFGLTPDPDYLFLGRVHQEALDHLRLGIESSAAFVVVTGDVGCGKTTLLQALLGSLDRNAAVARLVNTLLEPKELLEAILIDFGLEPGSSSKPALLREFARFLVDQRRYGQRVLVVIDEAQNLRFGALEELRMLSNLETEKSKLLQILLVGQPELRDRLACYDLEQLRQRISVRHHLGPLDAVDTAAYINHRLRLAALETPLIFGTNVTTAIHERSRGVPRIVNVICDATLLAGYSDDRREIDAPLVASVFDELEATGVLAPKGMRQRPWKRASVDPFWSSDVSVCELDQPARMAWGEEPAARVRRG